MFEPQDHPDDIAVSWRSADPAVRQRRLDARLSDGREVRPHPRRIRRPVREAERPAEAGAGKVTTAAAAGYTFSHAVNDSFTAINRLLAGGEEVSWLASGPQQGTFFVATKASTAAAVGKIAADLGLNFEGGRRRKPAGDAIKLRKLRIALADQYGGSMPSGWTRWLLEQFEFPFEVVFPPGARRGQPGEPLRRDHLPVRRRPGAGRGRAWRPRWWWRRWRRTWRRRGGEHPGPVSESARGLHGSPDRSTPQEVPRGRRDDPGGRAVVDEPGGAHGSAGRQSPRRALLGRNQPRAALGEVLRSGLGPPGRGRHDGADRARHDQPARRVLRQQPGLPARAGGGAEGRASVAWFDSPTPLRSGWAYGQGYLQGGVAVVDASVGKGKLFLFGPEITFRAQPHGTFKFLFNGIYLAARAPGAGAATDSAGRVP